MRTPQEEQGFWTETRERTAVVILCLVLFAAGLYERFDYTPSLPAMPAMAAGSGMVNSQALNASSDLYQQSMTRLADTFGVARPQPDDLISPFPYEVHDVKQTLAVDQSLDTPSLRLSASIQRLDVPTSAGSYQADHLILKIENKTKQFLAYQVVTKTGMSESHCLAKGALAQDAVGIAPGETVQRTECTYRPGDPTLYVDHVETMALTPLGYYLVSQVTPPLIGMDPRTTAGHTPPGGSPCGNIPDTSIRPALASGAATWQDLVDFYARHDCNRYMFQVGYRAFVRKGQYALPVTTKAQLGQP